MLAATTRVRSEVLPDIMGPAGMSAEVVQILNKAIARGLASADLRQRFLKAGLVPAASGPEELRKRYEDWMVIFGKIASDAGVKPH